jgi:hypothetical protein
MITSKEQHIRVVLDQEEILLWVISARAQLKKDAGDFTVLRFVKSWYTRRSSLRETYLAKP